MQTTIDLGDGQSVTLKATAATMLHYEERYGRDIMADMAILSGKAEQTEDARVSRIAWNIIHTMARDGDPSVPENLDEWLNMLPANAFFILLPFMGELWNNNTKGVVELKKKLEQQTGRSQRRS